MDAEEGRGVATAKRVDEGGSKEDDGAGLIQWLKGISLEELEALDVPAIIPGVNDVMLDEVISEVDGRTKKSKMRASRGLRGAAEIASAASGALENIGKQMRMKEGAENEVYSRECFTGCVLIPRDVEFFEARKTTAQVLRLGQDIAHEVASVKWTPLIRVEGVDPAIGVARIAAIAAMVKQAEFLSKTLLQKKGHNLVGQVVNHENFSLKMPRLKVKKNGTASEAAATHPEVQTSSGGGGAGASNLKRPSSTSVPKSKRAKALDSSVLVRVSKQDLFTKIAPERRLAAEAAVLHILHDEQRINDVECSGSAVAATIDDDVVLFPNRMEADASLSDPHGPKSKESSPPGFRIDMTTEPATIVQLDKSVRRRVTKSAQSAPAEVLCCCGCGLMTDSVQPCPRCSNIANGPMRGECSRNYRTCHSCPNTKFGGSLPKFIYDADEAVCSNADISAAHRLLEPSKGDVAKFEQLVLSSLPTPMHGLSKNQCIALMDSYGSDAEKRFNRVSSSTLLEQTLEDSEVTITDNVKLRDLRTLRYLKTSTQACLSWWINDVVVNDVMELINAKLIEGKYKVHCFNSFLLSRFRDIGYQDVKKWSVSVCKRHKVKSIFEFERIIMPVNLDNLHWAFIVADIRHKTIVYCDSMSGFKEGEAKEWMQLVHRYTVVDTPCVAHHVVLRIFHV